MTQGLEYTVCNLCGSDKYSTYYEQYDRRFSDTPRDIYQLVKCEKCGLVYLNPRPSKDFIDNFYPKSFYDWRIQITGNKISIITGLARKLDFALWRNNIALAEKARIVRKNCSYIGKLLDIGCAEGDFLERMKRAGWEVEGVEISADLCGFVMEKYGIKCHNAPVNELKLPRGSFDVATFWASLEHIFDPAGAVRLCHSILKRNGIIIILVPNSRSLEERILKGIDPNPIDIPRHLYHFNADTLEGLLRNNGFSVKQVRHFTLNAADRFTVLFNKCINREMSANNELSKLIRLILLDISIFVGDFVSGILSMFGRSHSVVVVGKREEEFNWNIGIAEC